MERSGILTYILLGKLGEITRGRCGRCKKPVDGVHGKYYCQRCGHTGSF